MDFGERQVFAEADTRGSEPFDAPAHTALPDILKLLPPPGSLPQPRADAGLNLRAAAAIAFSGAVHAGGLGLFLFLSPPVNEVPEVLEIPVEVVAETAAEQLAEVMVQAEHPLQEPEPPSAVVIEPPAPEPEMAVAREPIVVDVQQEPESVREPERIISETAPQPEPAIVEAAPAPLVPEITPAPVVEPEPQTPALEQEVAPLPLVPAPLVVPLPVIARPPQVLSPQILPPRAPPPAVKAAQPKRIEPPRAEVRREVEERTPAPRRTVEERRSVSPAPPRIAALPPPAARLPSPAAQAPSTASIGAWRSGVASRIGGNRTYPESARARGASGTTVVSLSIGPGGQLAGASVSGSSGHADLDAASISAVRRAAPFPPPPPGAPRALAVPFRYGLR